MTPYGNSSGHSGVISYEVRDQSIVIKFIDRERYLYNCDMPGKAEVDEMKRLARNGTGLATYINKDVRKRFAKKLS